MCHCYICGCFHLPHLGVEGSTSQRTNFVKKKSVKRPIMEKVKQKQHNDGELTLSSSLFRRQLCQYALFRLLGTSCSLPLGLYLNSHQQSSKTGDSRRLAVRYNLKDVTGVFAPRYLPSHSPTTSPQPPHHENYTLGLIFSASHA